MNAKDLEEFKFGEEFYTKPIKIHFLRENN